MKMSEKRKLNIIPKSCCSERMSFSSVNCRIFHEKWGL